jgi:hypothetical protein
MVMINLIIYLGAKIITKNMDTSTQNKKNKPENYKNYFQNLYDRKLSTRKCKPKNIILNYIIRLKRKYI